MILVACAVVYLMIGLSVAAFEAPPFDARTIFFWAFAIDIKVKYRFELRRIEREGAQRLAKAIVDRDACFEIVGFRWGDVGQAIITVSYHGVHEWRGSGMVWRTVTGDDKASEWLAEKLFERWKAEIQK